jgi:hypothetical protein
MTMIIVTPAINANRRRDMPADLAVKADSPVNCFPRPSSMFKKGARAVARARFWDTE